MELQESARRAERTLHAGVGLRLFSWEPRACVVACEQG